MSSKATIDAETMPGVRGWVTPVLVLSSAVLIGHAPLAVLHLRSLWQQEQYQYFPFVIGAIAWLLWSRWQEASTTTSAGRWTRRLAWPAAAVGLTMLIGSILVVSPWLAFVSLNVGLAAVFALLSRQRAIHYVWGIWLLLWLLVPLPLGVDDRLVTTLQRLSSQLSSTILDFFGILHLMSGNVLRLPSKEFFVDEACSGIISVMSMIASAAIYAVWRSRSFAHLVALVLAGVTWALALNVLRLCLIAGAHHFFDFDLSTGSIHEALGLALFLLMFLALVSTDYMLVMMLPPIDLSYVGGTGQENWLVRLWNRSGRGEGASAVPTPSGLERSETGRSSASPRMSTAVAWAVPFLILGVIQLAWLPSPETAETAQAIEQALALNDRSLPQKIGPWIRDSFESVERDTYSDFGKYSQTYHYRHEKKDGVKATVSLDFPYLGGWHDLCMCYHNAGWTIRSRVVESSPEFDQSRDWKFVAGDMEDPAMARAYISFAGFDAGGEVAEPPGEAVLYRPWFRLRRRLLRNIAPQLFQVQVFVPGISADDHELRRELKQLLVKARIDFRDQVAVPASE